MEYCENGDLSQYIEKKKKEKIKLTENEIWKIFIKILCGLADIHKKKILHRDIKSLNIFLKNDMDIRIGDLGVAKDLNKTLYAKTHIGTPYYLSPEVWLQKPYSYKSDIWSLGCVLYELCTYDFPFTAEKGSLIMKILNEEPKEIKYNYPKEIKDLIKQMLNKDHRKRPDCLKLLKMSIIKQKGLEFGIFEENKKPKPKPKPKPLEEKQKNQSNNPLYKSTKSKEIKRNEGKMEGGNNNNKNLRREISQPQFKFDGRKKIQLEQFEIKDNLKRSIREETHNNVLLHKSSEKKFGFKKTNKNIQKIELLPCKNRFGKIRDIKSSRNRIGKNSEKENKSHISNAKSIELFPCKEKIKVKNNIINDNDNDPLSDTINQNLKLIEENLFNSDNKNNSKDSNSSNNSINISNEGNDSIDLTPKNQLNEGKSEEKERYKDDLIIEQSNSINLDDLINDFNEPNSNDNKIIEDENENLENELEKTKKLINNLKEDIVKLIGEEKFQQAVNIYTIGIKDDSQKEKVIEDLNSFVERNSSKNCDKEKIYNILQIFLLECEYYKKKEQLNNL